MSDEDKETNSKRVEPLEVKSIKGVEGTERMKVAAIKADKEKDQ
jgi:hypothetical protein